MTRGPLHPDGRSQWDGNEWLPIQRPPTTLHVHFQIMLFILVMIAAMALVGSVLVE